MDGLLPETAKTYTFMLKYKAVIFDFDGVLVESKDIKTKAFYTLFADRGDHIVKQVVDYHKKHEGVSRYDKFRYYYKEILNEPLNDRTLNQLGKDFSNLVLHDVITAPMVKGAEEFLKKYTGTLKFYVVSGTPDEELNQIIMKRNLQDFFSGIYGSPKKKGDLILGIINNNYLPNEVVVVGDSITDYEGARFAGVDFIGRITGKNPFPANVTSTFTDFISFPRLLKISHG